MNYRFVYADIFGLRTISGELKAKPSFINMKTKTDEENFRSLVKSLLKDVTKKEFERDIEIINQLFTSPGKISREWEIYIEVAMGLGLID